MLKDNSEIANLVSRLLMRYANRVENGAVNAYQELLRSDVAKVVLTVSVHGSITDEPYFEPVVTPILLRSADPIMLQEDIVTQEVTEEKPKRKRNTQ